MVFVDWVVATILSMYTYKLFDNCFWKDPNVPFFFFLFELYCKKIMSIIFSYMCSLIPLICFWSTVYALLLSGLNDVIAGETGFEGFESSGEASSYISRPAGSEASCCYTEVHAGSCSGSGSSKGTECQDILRRASYAKIIGWTPCWSHQAGWGSIS